MTLRNVLGYAAEHPIDGGLILLDQEKAYDRIALPYLFLFFFWFSSPITTCLRFHFYQFYDMYPG